MKHVTAIPSHQPKPGTISLTVKWSKISKSSQTFLVNNQDKSL